MIRTTIARTIAPTKKVIPRPEGPELFTIHLDADPLPLFFIVNPAKARSTKGKPTPTPKSATRVHSAPITEHAASSLGSKGKRSSGDRPVIPGGATNTVPRMHPTMPAAISHGPQIRFVALGMHRHKIARDSTAIKTKPVATFQFICLKEVYPTAVSLDAGENKQLLPYFENDVTSRRRPDVHLGLWRRRSAKQRLATSYGSGPQYGSFALSSPS